MPLLNSSRKKKKREGLFRRKVTKGKNGRNSPLQMRGGEFPRLKMKKFVCP